MKTIGFLISEKENEKRRAITLEDIAKVKNKPYLYFQTGYGNMLGYSDEDIINLGCNVVSKSEILNCDIICEPKIGDSDDLKLIKNKTIFGWIHATQNYDITQYCVDNKLTVYAWEKMYDDKRHIFNKNNQIAGEAAVMHAMLLYGKKFDGLNIAVLGKGNTSQGAQRILKRYNANVIVYGREEEMDFKKNLYDFDVIVNCILWDVSRDDHIIFKTDLSKMKKGSLIIDVSCDRNGGIETSIPTTIDNPIYEVDGIIHYVVDHTPSLLYKDASKSISEEVKWYLDLLVEEKENKILKDCLIIKNGIILDKEINIYQSR